VSVCGAACRDLASSWLPSRGAAAAFSSFIIFSAFGLLEAIPQLPAYMRTGGFTPEGGYLPALIFLIPLLVLGVGNVLLHKEYTVKMVGIVCSVLIGLGIVASIWNLLPGSKFAPRFPDYGTSWSIAVDAIKNSPILGIGPGDYLTAFNRFRPLDFNATDLWAAKFATASNFYLTVFTETGLLGISGLILIILVLYRMLRKDLTHTEEHRNHEILYPAATLSLLFLLVIFPASFIVTSLIFVLLALTSKSKVGTLNLSPEGNEGVTTKLPALLLTLPVLAVTCYVLFRGAQIAKAEYTFNKALVSLSEKDAQSTIKYLDEAMKGNQTVDRYHMTTAQVSILLANAIAQKKDITEDDRKTIASLVQTAISQAKAGVALNPERAANWDILAQIYRSIMPFADGADDFAVQAASQAVALDPFNPNLRINLGGVYYAKGDYDNAIRAFETAVAARKNHPNAYYNLAVAYQQKGEFEKAETAISNVLSLVEKSSPDYAVAKKLLEDIQAKKNDPKKQEGADLTAPEEAKDILDPKIDLPEGSEPPATPEPSVTPSVTTRPSPTSEVLSPTLTVTPAQ
jgi:tetratricopeptide (TPR) repeat protein